MKMPKVFAKNLSNKQVMTTDGTEIGILDNIVMEVKTGKLEDLIVKPDIGLDTSKYITDGQFLKIPFKAVRSIKDYIVVDKQIATSLD
jgi:sporulation protein YlmC with PRC-barrel domain